MDESLRVAFGDIDPDERDWRPVGMYADEGFTLPFSPDYDPLPPLTPMPPETGLSEGDKATLWLLAIIAVVHLAPLVALIGSWIAQ